MVLVIFRYIQPPEQRMSIFQTNISLLNKFLNQFATCFSKIQLAMFTLLIYALFKDYKRNSLDAMAKATHTDYQKLQYFFSDSHWYIQALKRKRLEIIQKQRTTVSTKDGLLAIDYFKIKSKRLKKNCAA